jgi:hypothetical protein
VIDGYVDIAITSSLELVALKPTHEVQCKVHNVIRVAEYGNTIFFKVFREFVAIAVCWRCQSKRRHYQ